MRIIVRDENGALVLDSPADQSFVEINEIKNELRFKRFGDAYEVYEIKPGDTIVIER